MGDASAAPRSPGIADRTGSLTPGKQADVVIIDGSAVNVAPIIDPVGAVVCAADVSNVKTVLVAGKILKDDFRLKASLDSPRKAVEASRDYLVSKFGDPAPGLGGQGHRVASPSLPDRGHAPGCPRSFHVCGRRGCGRPGRRDAKRATGP